MATSAAERETLKESPVPTETVFFSRVEPLAGEEREFDAGRWLQIREHQHAA